MLLVFKFNYILNSFVYIYATIIDYVAKPAAFLKFPRSCTKSPLG